VFGDAELHGGEAISLDSIGIGFGNSTLLPTHSKVQCDEKFRRGLVEFT
jgi:hypothetical protein